MIYGDCIPSIDNYVISVKYVFSRSVNYGLHMCGFVNWVIIYLNSQIPKNKRNFS